MTIDEKTYPDDFDFIDYKYIEDDTGKRRQSVWADCREGRFPPPVKIGKRSVRWFKRDYRLWKERLAAERDAAVAFKPSALSEPTERNSGRPKKPPSQKTAE
ncbi:helix-turn-helix transcriptional regulator [Rhizobium mongolense]|uniref:helix-turn-helix transcriptional regulator n=1 Tax=Rhizobium TaxID=379 RepID=UPI0024B099C6|nr:AlpA family phage regulatory protein [Rhizobium sp. CC1099]WFU88873.1 AlpA family phage regulatory protein [Rhizobium sp. CC1099]